MHEEELLGLDVCQAEKDSQKAEAYTARCHRRAEDWPLHDSDEAANRLCQHWGSVFQAREVGIPRDHVDTMLSFVQSAPRDLN